MSWGLGVQLSSNETNRRSPYSSPSLLLCFLHRRNPE
ncbi:unnamed protein product [Linum tenue]|uniref:Uncharacterized protein n=1 Tax=Linum tenue TaxID=586396 RepID=A0AAV0L3Y7_9ROSI|nr:unnamed protein product [Linum tenue]